jgi:hypothetical protein
MEKESDLILACEVILIHVLGEEVLGANAESRKEVFGERAEGGKKQMQSLVRGW